MAFSSYCPRPYGENMHGSETSVLLPQAVTRGEVQHPAPCELRGGLPRIAVEAQFAARAFATTSTSRRGRRMVAAGGCTAPSSPIGSCAARAAGLTWLR